MGVQQEHANSFLPPEIAQCYQKLPQTGRDLNSKQFQSSPLIRTDIHTANNKWTMQWRRMTAELLQSTYVQTAWGPSDTRNSAIHATVALLDNIMQPYADPRMDNTQRRRNLEEIVKRSALFAFTLFSQPSLWNFDWKEEQSVTSGDLCIFPALMQVIDETGEAVTPPRPFSEAVVRRLDA